MKLYIFLKHFFLFSENIRKSYIKVILIFYNLVNNLKIYLNRKLIFVTTNVIN